MFLKHYLLFSFEFILSQQLSRFFFLSWNKNPWKRSTALEIHELLILLTPHNHSAQEIVGESGKNKLARNNNRFLKWGSGKLLREGHLKLLFEVVHS